jgi:hypothetical protein
VTRRPHQYRAHVLLSHIWAGGWNVAVDQERQATQRERRRLIISSLSDNFALDDATSPISRLRDAMSDGRPRMMIANSDVDGLTAASMIASVTNWRIAALVDKTGYRQHPDFSLEDAIDDPEALLFGVDVFSALFPGISNHPVFFGPKPNGDRRLRQLLGPFDESMANMARHHGAINVGAWASTAALRDAASPNGMPYKYPLGTAQLALAALEGAGVAPKFFDRQYLPWLVANCDGGLETIRKYPWNVELWWSALAAVVGPASLSEHLYRIATTQRPTEFIDADRRLRYEEPTRSLVLDSAWNLNNDSSESIETFLSLLTDWTGWADPMWGGQGSLIDWIEVAPTRSILKTRGLTLRSDTEIQTHLNCALRGVHVGFSSFDGEIRLGWSLANQAHQVEEALAPVNPMEPVVI